MNAIFKKARDPISSYTHCIGAVFAIIGTIVLVIKSALSPTFDIIAFCSVLVFGFSMISLYTASSVYHFVSASPEKLLRLRKMDHAMIYVLIAGSYTPLLLKFFNPDFAVIFTICIWTLAFIGIIIKIFWFHAPRMLSTSLYLLLGWAIAVDFSAILKLSSVGLVLLALGGFSYTIGGIIYAIKKPNLSAEFGFHEIFHVFVMLGTFFHFLVVLFFVI
ncbi:MAG: hemolysin III family protein [Oscillospiraceae bacterium]